MAYGLEEINRRAAYDAKGFVEQSDAEFNEKVKAAASSICANICRSPIVLLSGPSGSGKTTTAAKLKEELKRRGVLAHTISIDNYYKDRSSATLPIGSDGKPDLESPLCIDMELLGEHFNMLSRGQKIAVPKYNFHSQTRLAQPLEELVLRGDEIAIFEGIHALNSAITNIYGEAFKLYISARSNILEASGKVCFKGTWIRLSRRVLRDNLFRGADAGVTLGMWASVRRGEKMYISPFKNKANILLDSSLPYEVSVMKPLARELFLSIPEGIERFAEIESILPALDLFREIESSIVAPNSLLREFIGGGIYDS